MKKTVICAILIVAILVMNTAAVAADLPSATGEIFAMDTYMTLTCYGEDSQAAIDESLAEIKRLDALLSIGSDESEISILNREGSAIVSEDTAAMLNVALDVYSAADHAFEITILPIMKLWGFTSGELHVPTADELTETLKRVGSDQLTWNPETRSLVLGQDQSIDLGGIAKGYASDRLWKIFYDHGIVSAVISLGGNVECYGAKPNGAVWRVGIQNPYDTTGLLGIAEVINKCVITSGDYERFFTDEETGAVYHHIIDPATGYPAESGLHSVTIVSESGTLADTLSTTCFIMGIDKSTEYWRNNQADFEIIFFTDDDEIFITEGLKDSFSSDQYPVHVIPR